MGWTVINFVFHLPHNLRENGKNPRTRISVATQGWYSKKLLLWCSDLTLHVILLVGKFDVYYLGRLSWAHELILVKTCSFNLATLYGCLFFALKSWPCKVQVYIDPSTKIGGTYYESSKNLRPFRQP